MSTRLLLITNDVQMMSLVEDLLARYAFEIVVKNTLRKAAHFLVRETTPQLVLLDLSVHRSDGIDFLAKMRSLQRFAQLPILVTVVEPDPKIIKDVLQAGANRYLTKIFLPTNLLRTLEEMNDKTLAGKK